MIEAYPLCWPSNKARTPNKARMRAKFGKQEIQASTGWKSTKSLTVAQAITRVLGELDRFTKIGHTRRVPTESIIISTNIPVSKTGFPYSDRREPDDVGVAVYFTLDKKSYCMPCDAWDRVADNLAAVAAHLYCVRGIERYQVGESHDVFTGFRALPSTEPAKREWYVVLGISANAGWAEAEKAYRKRAIECHPDKPGGSHQAFIELQEAWAVVEKHLKQS